MKKKTAEDSMQATLLHTPELGSAEFDELRALIHSLTGISLGDGKRVMLTSRLARRLRALHLSDFRSYVDFVHADATGSELGQLVNCVTTNKTEFFREPLHFDYLARTILPAAVARARAGGRRTLRIWSAGCSTGEEPYTLAMTLLDHLPAGSGLEARILASDIDTDVLARAERGVFESWRMNSVPEDVRRRHFLRGRGDFEGSFRISQAARDLVAFRRINFVDERWPIRTRFDVIFCRNVVIYFDRPTQERLFRRFATLLEPDGHLVIGHSESLFWLDDVYRGVQGTIYRHAGDESAPPRPAHSFERSLERAPVRAPRPAAPPPPQIQNLGIGDVAASGDPVVLRTVLGSCVAACLYDPVARVGGMNHFLVPDGEREGGHHSRLGVHAMEMLINAVMKLGGERRRLRAKLCGGGHVLEGGSGACDVGAQNIAFVRRFLEVEGIPVEAERLGGKAVREIRFEPQTGNARVRVIESALATELRAREPRLANEFESSLGRGAGEVTLF